MKVDYDGGGSSHNDGLAISPLDQPDRNEATRMVQCSKERRTHQSEADNDEVGCAWFLLLFSRFLSRRLERYGLE